MYLKLSLLFLGKDDEDESFITGGWVYTSPSLECPVRTFSEVSFFFHVSVGLGVAASVKSVDLNT